MNMTRWLVIGISGTTCSGKTTLAKRIQESLKNSTMISQDTYFIAEDDPRHIKIPELNYFNNWEILSSLDMHKMHCDVLKVLGSSSNITNINKTIISNGSSGKSRDLETRVLILEGFLLFEYKPITDLCNLKYMLTLTGDQCWERRRNRVYEPPDCPHYFEIVCWPEYERYIKEIRKDKKLFEEIQFLDGADNKDDIFTRVFNDVLKRL